MHTSLSKRQEALAPRQQVDNDWANNRRYSIVIDAGSSGSRVYIYSWKDHEYVRSTQPAEALKGSIPIIERGDPLGLKWTKREEPGISSFGSKPHEVGDHISLLLDFAKEVVPSDSHVNTPVFLMATAGMRLLPQEEQNAVLDETCSYIRKNYPFFISDCDTHIRVIPGELEGIYGWVAVNYLMGGFDTSIQASIDQAEPQHENKHHTFGFLDMGGASAQIAFEPEHHQRQEHFDDLTRIYLHTLDGQKVEYDVFVTTFLGYGSNEARRRYLEERVRIAYTEANGRNLLDEHHQLHIDDPCLPFNLNMTNSDSTSVPLVLHGTGSFSQCIEYTTPLLNKDAECPTKPCLFNGVHTPHIDWSVNKFVGISEYWYSSHDILGLGGVYDFVEYEKKATEYCIKDWSLEDHKELDAADVMHHQMQCFKSAWIVNVLHDGIGIPRLVDPNHNNASDDRELLEQSIESIESKNWSPPFQSIDTINDIQVSWTLGAMVLHATNQIPLAEQEDSYHKTDDEGAHQIADGVELPSSVANEDTLFDDAGNVLSSFKEKTSLNTLGIMLLMVICSLFFWYLYRRLSRHKRRDWESANGGLLGARPTEPSGAYAAASALAHVLSRSTLVLRSWASRILRKQSSSPAPAIEIDSFMPEGGSTVGAENSISISIPGSGSGSSTPSGRPMLGPSSRSQSFVNMKYWSKKRYSGDSHATLFPPESNSHRLPLRSSSSAVNLANRNISSNSVIEEDV
ncbi:nucleoside phosphatase family-domain-containing protein [Syncephalastrum racemosum]|uniref:Nucleoside phosphatase family-domain-containing protein n=1 Tax=Syncephalastrum racemosum TaxID=13706 RepID=A0A1X2HH87_SYNRA|nr:nucleoside phosphatase family-domain-containing protein [Syncephalastrum racemosum]